MEITISAEIFNLEQIKLVTKEVSTKDILVWRQQMALDSRSVNNQRHTQRLCNL